MKSLDKHRCMVEMPNANKASDNTKLDFIINGASDMIRANNILFRHIWIYFAKTNRFGPPSL